MGWWWSYLLAAVGCTGFLLAGRNVWWAWWINVGCQGLWAAYAVVTQQWGFLLSTPIYLVVFIPNAVRWTRAHFAKPCTCVGHTRSDPNCPRHARSR